jgi:hypothetical protein
MVPYLIFDFDPDPSAFTCVADVLMIDLDGIDCLDQIRLLTSNMDHVAHVDLAIGQLDDADIYSRIIVNDTPDQRFSYANSHNSPPSFLKIDGIARRLPPPHDLAFAG